MQHITNVPVDLAKYTLPGRQSTGVLGTLLEPDSRAIQTRHANGRPKKMEGKGGCTSAMDRALRTFTQPGLDCQVAPVVSDFQWAGENKCIFFVGCGTPLHLGVQWEPGDRIEPPVTSPTLQGQREVKIKPHSKKSPTKLANRFRINKY